MTLYDIVTFVWWWWLFPSALILLAVWCFEPAKKVEVCSPPELLELPENAKQPMLQTGEIQCVKPQVTEVIGLQEQGQSKPPPLGELR